MAVLVSSAYLDDDGIMLLLATFDRVCAAAERRVYEGDEEVTAGEASGTVGWDGPRGFTADIEASAGDRGDVDYSMKGSIARITPRRDGAPRGL